MRASFAARLVDAWYAPRLTVLTLPLAPLSLLFGALAALRRALYRAGLLRSARLRVPLIVVGNIAVGGTGKTPLVIALAQRLRERGWHPGVVSRGTGRDTKDVRIVRSDASAGEVGDEPLIVARRGLPVAVGRERAAAGAALLAAQPQCDVLIADDGLQHYAMARDVEIAVLDGARALGNGWLLPAGPLREPAARLGAVDAVVVNAQSHAFRDAFAMRLVADRCVNLARSGETTPLRSFAGKRVHAVAGIGHPGRFFAMLRDAGIVASAHAFADHHRFEQRDLAFDDDQPVLMTEKDAVKCGRFADDRCWFVPVRADIDEALVDRVMERLRSR